MKKNVTILGFAILLIAFIASCAKMPQEEYDAAQDAMDSLKAHFADVYLPDEFEEFETTYDEAMTLVKDKKYGKGKESLTNVLTLAEELEEANNEKKEELLEELQEIYDEAFELNNDNKNKIPKSGGSARVMSYRSDVDDVSDALQEVADIIKEEGNLVEATEIATEALEDSEDIEDGLDAALAAAPSANRKATSRPQLRQQRVSTSMSTTKKKK